MKVDNSSGRLIEFYDTTLRDGEQMPEVAFSREERIKIAKGLDKLGIDEIEVGFSAAGAKQREDMQAVVNQNLNACLTTLARPVKQDIDQAKEIGVDGVTLFAPVSPLHLEHKLRQSYEQVCETAVDAVKYARSLGLRAQFTFEDSTRTDLDRLVEMSNKLADAGAYRIGMADTVGIGTPKSMERMVERLVAEVRAPIAVHCHNDFGLAVANSLAAVEAGASLLSNTMCGIGERSGNTAAEECAAALEILYGFRTNLNLEYLYEVASLVHACARVPMSKHKAIVGENSFRHESGIHVAAILREPLCYEPYDPALVGHARQIVLGKTSGKTAIRHFAGEMADKWDNQVYAFILDRMKELTEGGEQINFEFLSKIIEEYQK